MSRRLNISLQLALVVIAKRLIDLFLQQRNATRHLLPQLELGVHVRSLQKRMRRFFALDSRLYHLPTRFSCDALLLPHRGCGERWQGVACCLVGLR